MNKCHILGCKEAGKLKWRVEEESETVWLCGKHSDEIQLNREKLREELIEGND